MIIVNDRQSAKRLIFIAFGVFFLLFWGMMVFVVRPRIEGRLRATTEESLPKIEEMSGVEVVFRGRDGVVSGVFAEEEERGRVQSLVASMRVEGSRKITSDFRLREALREAAVFSFVVRDGEILAEGSLSTVEEKRVLLGALRSVANGRAIVDEVRVSDRTAGAGWVRAAEALVPALVGGSEQTQFRIEGGKLVLGGEALNDECRKAIEEGLPEMVKAGLGIENKLTVAAPPEAPGLRVSMVGGTAVLEGLLPGGGAREIVVNGTQRGVGAGTVEDRLVVGERVLPPRWMEGLGDFLAVLLAQAENVELAISESQFRVAGRATTEAAKGKLEAMARSMAAASGLEVASGLTAPVPLDSAVVALAFGGDGIKITGRVPSEEVRATIRTAVRRGSGNVPLEEVLEPRENTAMPGWIGALDVFVPHLLINARSGTFRIEHELVYVSARLPSEENLAALEGALGAFAASSGLEVSERQFLLVDPPGGKPSPLAVEEPPTPAATVVEAVPVPEAEAVPVPPTEGEPQPMAGRPGNLAPPAFLPEFAIYFGHGTAMLKAADEARIKEMAGAIRTRPGLRLVVAGYSDSSGNRDFNEWLGGRRADEVRKLLVRGGVEASRLDLRVFAAVGPTGADKEDPRLREFRRVEILVEKSPGSATESVAPPEPAPREVAEPPAGEGADARADAGAAPVETVPAPASPEAPETAGEDLADALEVDFEDGISDEMMDALFAKEESQLLDFSAAPIGIDAPAAPAEADENAVGAGRADPEGATPEPEPTNGVDEGVPSVMAEGRDAWPGTGLAGSGSSAPDVRSLFAISSSTIRSRFPTATRSLP